ncbi:Uncharacterized protein HZ326_19734 [Fusarium oxysporum f. sp. albedinis]|nr:Uncharacterized protein HZ326_19734 [Fusarium oxysporum f. sp. albedinis]
MRISSSALIRISIFLPRISPLEMRRISIWASYYYYCCNKGSLCQITQNLARARSEVLLHSGKIVMPPLILHSDCSFPTVHVSKISPTGLHCDRARITQESIPLFKSYPYRFR